MNTKANSRMQSNDLCSLVDSATLKGDLELAQRLLIQADINDPRNPHPQERLEWIDREIARLEPLESTVRPLGRKFDFLYTPTLRGLSTELSSMLPLHPDVFAVPKHELDRAIECRNESGLLAKYQQWVLNKRERLAAGLVQHAFIAGQLAGPEVAERLASVTTRKRFIHGVRDPMRLVISDFNHQLIANHGGSYMFWPVCPGTPFCWAKYELTGGPKYKRKPPRKLRRRFEHLRIRVAEYSWGLAMLGDRGLPSKLLVMHDLSKFSLNADLVEKQIAESLNRPRHFAVGQTYAKYFDDWLAVDLERPVTHDSSVISRVFEGIGVDPNLANPAALRASEGTTVHRCMVQNWIRMEAYGHALHLRLGYADRAMFSNSFPFAEMLPFDPDDRFTRLGIGGQRLCVTVDRVHWRLLPRELRIRLVESEELIKFRDTILIPAWLDSYERWKSGMDKYLIRSLEPKIMERLRKNIGGDLEQFLKRHPQFEQKWTSVNSLVGN
jgi:hypothetical protein